ncbi:hypothetical protein KKC63_00965 [Patescibacteria group bacterium]|nr:hypothetical protein [Patescibacteria group bacterium]
MKFNQTLFWDIDPKTIDKKKHSQYIIERILEFGSDKNVKWLFNTYNTDLLKKVVKQSRSLSPKTKSLWNLILNNK